MTTRKYWTDAEVAELRIMYPHIRTAVLAGHFRRPEKSVYAKAHELGVRKTEGFLRAQNTANGPHLAVAGRDCRFKPGLVPHNKGKRRPGWNVGRMAETWFKPGSVSKRWDQDEYCIGALRITHDGIFQIKLGCGTKNGWVQMARYVWWSETGRWPRSDYVVRSKNGDPFDVRPENLECISRRQNMARNSIHNLPPELKSAVIQLGALKRQINRREGRAA